MAEELEKVKMRLSELTSVNFELDMNNKKLTSHNESLKAINQRLDTDLKHHQALSKAALVKLEVIKRENRELEQMKNHEALKYQLDIEHYTSKIQTL